MRFRTAAFAALAALPLLLGSIGASSAPQQRIPVTVELTRVGDNLRVVYKLAQSVPKFSFAYSPVADRDTTWEVKTSGIRMAGRDVVSSRGSFDQFELLIHPGIETS